jgi:hypothetical protein
LSIGWTSDETETFFGSAAAPEVHVKLAISVAAIAHMNALFLMRVSFPGLLLDDQVIVDREEGLCRSARSHLLAA